MDKLWLGCLLLLVLGLGTAEADLKFDGGDVGEEGPPKVNIDLGVGREASRTDNDLVQREKETIKLDGLSVVQLKEIREKADKLQFQAEVPRMMKLIINSLYRNKDIFLRELISNASDVLEKIRPYSLTDSSVLDAQKGLSIRFKIDKEGRLLHFHISDTGIGMTREELVKKLEKIVKSGTSEFLSKMQEAGDIQQLSDQIGQFGVGFYSSFLVADKVIVTSKSNDDKQYIWESDAAQFSVAEDPRGPTLKRGTQVSLQTKEEAGNYLEENTVRELVKKYSQFINFPIYLWTEKTVEEEVPSDEEPEEKKDDEDEAQVESKDSDDDKPKTKKVSKIVHEWELINNAKPIWTRKPAEVEQEEYEEFYKTLTKDTQKALTHPHFIAEGEVTFKALLFVPSVNPSESFNKYGTRTDNIKVYVRRVFITDDFLEIMPNYLSFIREVVDSDDLPLNVSRKNFQQRKLINATRKIRKTRLDKSPCALVTSHFGWTGNMERIIISQTHSKPNDISRDCYFKQKKTFEMNPRHPLLKEFLRRVNDDPADPITKETSLTLFRIATLRSGYMLKDTVDFADTVEKMMRQSLGVPMEEEFAKEEYAEFYKTLTNDTQKALTHTHFIAEGEVTFKALLFFPSVNPSESFNKYGTRTDNIKLYVRRVFITDDFLEMMPNNLAFITLVEDSDDLPLNVSRKNLQQRKLIKVIGKKRICKTLDMLKKLDGEAYEKFWKEYSTNIKLGVIEDTANKNRLAKLLRFATSASPTGTSSLTDYVSRMKDKQQEIYYMARSSPEEAEKSPFVERLLKEGYEVIYLTEAFHEYCIGALPEFEGKKFQNVAKERLFLSDGKDKLEDTKKIFNNLTKWLEDDALKDQIEKNQTDAPTHNRYDNSIPKKMGCHTAAELMMRNAEVKLPCDDLPEQLCITNVNISPVGPTSYYPNVMQKTGSVTQRATQSSNYTSPLDIDCFRLFTNFEMENYWTRHGVYYHPEHIGRGIYQYTISKNNEQNIEVSCGEGGRSYLVDLENSMIRSASVVCLRGKLYYNLPRSFIRVRSNECTRRVIFHFREVETIRSIRVFSQVIRAPSNQIENFFAAFGIRDTEEQPTIGIQKIDTGEVQTLNVEAPGRKFRNIPIVFDVNPEIYFSHNPSRLVHGHILALRWRKFQRDKLETNHHLNWSPQTTAINSGSCNVLERLIYEAAQLEVNSQTWVTVAEIGRLPNIVGVGGELFQSKFRMVIITVKTGAVLENFVLFSHNSEYPTNEVARLNAVCKLRSCSRLPLTRNRIFRQLFNNIDPRTHTCCRVQGFGYVAGMTVRFRQHFPPLLAEVREIMELWRFFRDSFITQ